MHPLNPYAKQRPDFAQLAQKYPDFAPHVSTSESGHASIDFRDPAALRGLTRCLLKADWKLDVDLREDRLCPTVANRVEYLLHVLDIEPFLADGLQRGSDAPLRVLDIGTGAYAIYLTLLHRLRPSAKMIGTEIDETSYRHAQQTLSANPGLLDSISLLQPEENDGILLPAMRAYPDGFHLIICNPPFFGSAEEMQEGSEIKAVGAHAAPTASSSELITRGGEVSFVGRMIEESLEIRETCSWYTSLIGKFSSLQPLVGMLQDHKIDNYFITSIKPARTVRWILGWSHTAVRLPDTITRPHNLIPNTAFAKLLPPPNTISHTPLHPPLPLEQLRQAVRTVLDTIGLAPSDSGIDHLTAHEGDDSFALSPRSNTWSRAARRQTARQQADPKPAPAPQSDNTPAEPIMVVKLSFIPPPAPSEAAGDPSRGDWRGATLRLDWVRGREREVIDGFWKFLLNKSGLLGNQGKGGDQVSRGDGAGGRGYRGKGRGH